MDPKVFDYLKKAARMSLNREKLPTLYLLSLTKYLQGSLKSVRKIKSCFIYDTSPFGAETHISVYQRPVPPYSCSGGYPG